MESKKKLTQGQIFVSLILLGLLFLIFRSIYIRYEVCKSNHYIVAKYILRDDGGKTVSYRFAYFVNGKKIKSSNIGVNISMFTSKSETEKINNLQFNTFYYAKLNPKYPNVIIVDLDKPINDTLVIMKGGFSIEEMSRIEEE